MNPPTEEFVKAIEALNAEKIIIIPNNSNIILTAEQTIDLCPDQVIRVLKTKNIAQGYASLMVFDPTVDIDENIEEMMEVISSVHAGEVTYAVRDTQVNGVQIKNGDFIGISGGEILVSTNNQLKTVKELAKKIVNEEAEIITIFYGKDVKQEEVLKLVEFIEKLNPDLEEIGRAHV